MCVRAQAMGFELYPSRGEGYNSEFKGKNIRFVEAIGITDEGDQVDIWAYYDHGVKMDFYVGKIHRREEPRFWMPDPVPPPIRKELTTERLITKKVGDRKKQIFEHKESLGPNDYGDCCKKQFVFRVIVVEGLH